MSRTKVAVFASGNGSNFDTIGKQAISGNIPCQIEVLVCDQPQAKVIEKAHAFDIPVFTFDPKAYVGKEGYEKEIVKKLQEAGVKWVFLAGYMRLIGSTLLRAYEGRIVNIHPSLLPAFPGKDAIGQAFEAGVKVSGVTIHYVDEGMDTGPIIEQAAVRIDASDDRVTLQQNIQRIEHKLYPKVMRELLTADV